MILITKKSEKKITEQEEKLGHAWPATSQDSLESYTKHCKDHVALVYEQWQSNGT